jgi:hypothetical protein
MISGSSGAGVTEASAVAARKGQSRPAEAGRREAGIAESRRPPAECRQTRRQQPAGAMQVDGWIKPLAWQKHAVFEKEQRLARQGRHPVRAREIHSPDMRGQAFSHAFRLMEKRDPLLAVHHERRQARRGEREPRGLDHRRAAELDIRHMQVQARGRGRRDEHRPSKAPGRDHGGAEAHRPASSPVALPLLDDAPGKTHDATPIPFSDQDRKHRLWFRKP